MPIIGHVGRRSLKVRALNTTLHVLLILGAATMVYPILIMLTGSVKSAVDSRRLEAIPSYFYDEDMLYRKWIEAKYNEQTVEYNGYRQRIGNFENVSRPPKPVEQRWLDWNEFLDATPAASDVFHSMVGPAAGNGVRPELIRKFIGELKQEEDVGDSIERLNVKYDQTFPTWDTVWIPVYNFVSRSNAGATDKFYLRTMEFCSRQGRCNRYFYSLDACFTEIILRPRAGRTPSDLNRMFHTEYVAWDSVTLPRKVPDGPLRQVWIEFVAKWLNLQFVQVSPEAEPLYQAYLENERYLVPAELSARYANGIEILNERYGTAYKSFREVPLPQAAPAGGIPLQDWDKFVTSKLPGHPEWLTITSTEFLYRDFLAHKYGTLDDLIAAHKFGLESLDGLAFPEKQPDLNTRFSADWLEFVNSRAEADWLSPDPAAYGEWRAFLTKPYRAASGVDMTRLNEDLGTGYGKTDDIFLPVKKPANEKLAERWTAFVRVECPRNLVVVDAQKATPHWREFIRGKYPDAASLNAAYALTPVSFDTVSLPVDDVDYFEFQNNRKHIFWEFVKRNYAAVFSVMLVNGRAIQNTIIYCLMAVAGALLVNPLAAYALSRYKPPSQFKLLLFLMLTMAFPTMVLGIPNFLMIRSLGLLNTYWALVLPGVANGYSIFLLKGFFDSLPKELYESAQLDGASEWTMFWRITMATSTPILAVIALNAFQAAYANFMFAFILCQDPNRWTIMVHLYQLQQESAQAVTFASLVIAAIPTLLVFLLCQNVIMRGIVVPTEK